MRRMDFLLWILFSSTTVSSFCFSNYHPTICRTTQLFLAAKKKKKSTKGNSGRGAGFGTTKKATTAAAAAAATATATTTEPKPPQQPTKRIIIRSAAEIARLNTFYTKQQYDTSESSVDGSSSLSLEDEELTRRLTALYTEEYVQETLRQSSSIPRQLIQVSSSPLIFTIDNFINPAACQRVQNNAAGCFDLMFPEIVSDGLFDGQESEMDGLLFNTASSRDHATKHHEYPDGLHMDTNNQCLFRHVTCLLYLNDVPKEAGGATVFPLARALPNDPALIAARTLLDHRISHTRSREIESLGLSHEARLLEERSAGTQFPKDPTTNTVIRIQPKAGRLLIFFSRDSDGREDPRAWHAGGRILPDPVDGRVVEKRILTLFKEVDGTSMAQSTTTTAAACTLEQYLAPMIQTQRNWLQAKAKLQQALLLSQQSSSTLSS